MMKAALAGTSGTPSSTNKFVTNADTRLSTNLVVDGPNTTTTGTLTINNNTVSGGVGNGALVVGGGVGIGGALNVGSNLAVTGTLNSGAATLASAGITGALNVGGNAVVTGTLDSGAATLASAVVSELLTLVLQRLIQHQSPLL